MDKLKNQITININDSLKNEIDALATYYQRKPAELVRLLLIPAVVNAYAAMMTQAHTENKNNFEKAIFKQ